MYAIVETGGKQYKVTSGQVIDVELLEVAEGSAIELDRVLFIGDGDKVTVGTPTVEGAKVLATSKGDDRAKKVTAFKYKNKTRYSKKTGHRQPYTSLSIDQILEPGAAPAKAAPVKRVRRSKSEVTESGT